MPTAAELDRVQALVKRLNALGSAQRGDLILAQQWNDLIGLVVELAQSMLDANAGDRVPPHEHPDQVSMTWLSPTVRSLLEKGPLADPKATTRVNDVEGRVRAVAADLDKLRGTIGSARDRLTELATRDLVREADANEVRLVVGALSERRDDVLEVRRTLGSISEKVDKAVEASSRLVIDGQPADLNALNARIAGVEELRDRLRTTTGDLLDAAELEKRLATLRNSLVTQEQLETAFKNRPVQLDPNALDGLRGDLLVQVREETKSTLATLSGEIRGETEAKLGGVDALVEQRIQERVGAVVGVEITKLRGENKDADQTLLNTARAFTQSEVATATTTLRGEVGALIGAVDADVKTRIPAELASLLPDALAPLQAAVNAARTDAAAVVTKLGDLSNTLTQARARIEQVALAGTAAATAVRTELLGEIATRDAATRKEVDKRILEVEGRLNPRLTGFDNRFTALDASMQTTIDARAAEAASAALKAETVKLRAEMETIARTQSLALQDQVTENVRRQVDTSLNERIVAESKRAVRNEVTSDTFRKSIETIAKGRP
jgi:hypothetical protein